MNSLDFIIILVVIAIATRSFAIGFLRAAGSAGGFALGLIGGAVIAPPIADSLSAASGPRSLLVLAILFGAAFTISGLGETIGIWLSTQAERYQLGRLNGLLGAVFGGLFALVAIWLMTATFARSAGPGLTLAMQNSRILQVLDSQLPPAPDVLARVERSLGINNFPRVFTGLEPTPAPAVTGPNAAAVNAAAAAARDATVKIQGAGCGGVVEGSGFVVGSNLVATNAHVVAGIASPIIIDGRGAHRATVVVFDPDLDFAVLRASGLAAAPLTVSATDSPRGTVGAALGYPGGGDFTVSPAAVLTKRTAVGRNIYDAGLVRRSIYELQAVVRPGNSGGPLVTPDGTVIGIIFATSTVNDQIGYALTSSEIQPDLAAATTAGPVATGACVAD